MNIRSELATLRVLPFLRFAYAFVYAALVWAGTLAALKTWLDVDPHDSLARFLATTLGVLFGFHVWGAANKFGPDIERAVLFPFKFPVAIGFAIFATYCLTRFFSVIASFALFGHTAGLNPGLELFLGFVLAMFAVGVFEALIFESEFVWFVLPALAAKFLRWTKHNVPSPREFAERLAQLREDERRGVRRRHDDTPIRTAAEARRRAEGLN